MSLLKLEDFTQEIDKLTVVLDRQLSIISKFGVEIEFYLRNQGKKLVAVEEVEIFKKELGANGITLEEEKGLDQFEIQIDHTSNISKLLNSIDARKSDLVSTAKKLGLEILFDPKPFRSDYGSSMHFHLSLHDQEEHNIFSEGTISTNKLLNNVISAVLLMLNQSLYFICGDSLEEYDRFIPNFMAPVNVSWGGNNRTTAIRIPESNMHNRRIEFRIPSASCNPQKIIFFLLLASIISTKHIDHSIDRIYGNATDNQYNLTELYDTPSSAKKNYLLDEIYGKILEKNIYT